VKIYLDVSCLNRPFDDQEQVRIRLEAEAVLLILERIESGEWEQVSSEAATIEINVNPDAGRRARVSLLLPEQKYIMKLTSASWRRAAELVEMGFHPGDAAHVSAAEQVGAEVLLSCDDRFCRLAKRCQNRLLVRVANPMDWLKEIDNVSNA
jgi:hypothetical protein